MAGLRLVVVFVGALGLGLLLAAPAPAQAPQLIGEFRDWAAYTYEEGQAKVCYIASQPKKDEGKYTRRGDIWTLVTHRVPSGGVGVVGIIAGYEYKKDSEVVVDIGGTTFRLYTSGDKAWARDADDRALVGAMKAGRTMVVKGTSWRGTKTKDTYSLLGFTRAYHAIGKACGVG